MPEMRDKPQSILDRYKKGYVTDEHLSQYLELGVITQDEYDLIYATKHSSEVVTE